MSNVMVKDETFDALVAYLSERIGPSVREGYGDEDTSPKKSKEAELCDLFEHYTYMDGQGYFLLSSSGFLYVYNGKYYEKVTTETFLNEVIKTVLTKIGVGKMYCKFSNKFIAKECLSGMENKRLGRFIPNRRYIVFSNGIFDIKEGVLKPFGRDMRTDIVLDIDYDKDAVNSLWESKIVEIIPNREMRDAFQMFCGSLLIDRDEVRIEYVCFLLGPGSNGKSIIASAIANVFGDEYFTNFDPDQLLNDKQRMYHLAALDGAIANFTDDLQQGSLSSSGFKSFASGAKFEARHPYGKRVFKVKAPPLLCCSNALPSTTDDSWGYHRRILPIYSSNRVWTEKDQDSSLKYKLSCNEARTAIFNWIYEGYRKIIANGGNIRLGQDVIDAQQEAREDSNSVRRWLRDRMLVKVTGRSPSDQTWKPLKEWYSLYKEYCLENGEKGIQIARSVAKILREKGFEESHRNTGTWFCIGTFGVDVEDETAEEETMLEDLPF